MRVKQRIAETAHPAITKHARYVNPAFVELLGIFGYGRVFTRALDVWIWDHQQRKYLDLLAGFGAVNIGHNHPRLLARLQNFLSEEALNFSHLGPSPQVAELAEAIAQLTAPLEISLFANSGSEAVEAGMKLARAATGRSGFIYCQGGFHGTNFGTLSIMGSDRLRKPFEPLLNDCTAIAFGDLAALANALANKRAAAFIVEPIQGEAGIIMPPIGYLKAAQQLCQKHGTLLILDEIQTGLGRTGSLFAYQAADFVPDILALAKSLSGALAAISATVTTPEIYQRAYGSIDRFDLHSSTFGGNTLSTVTALETLKIIADEQLTENSARMGKLFIDGLTDKLAGHPLVKQIRGSGLLIGVELGPTDNGWLNKAAPALVALVSKHLLGQWIAVKLLEHGIICQPASQCWNILRFEPPLTIKAAEIEQAVDTIVAVLAEYQSVTPIIKAVAARLGEQFWNNWSFE